MKQSDVYCIGHEHADHGGLSWDGDNRWWICSFLIPNLKLSDIDRAVMYWTYGWREGKSWEMESDGETLVRDYFMDGKIKNPAGVVHDALNRIKDHTTKDGHVWTVYEANAIYRRIQTALGATPCLAWRRWAGLNISYWLGLLPGIPAWWR